MPEVTQESMSDYLKENLPFIMMTMEDAQSKNLWDLYGGTAKKIGVHWDLQSIPPEVLKKVWDYTYTLFMQEQTNPGVLEGQRDLGYIRYVLNKKGWKWGGSHYVQGVYRERFSKGNDLLWLQYGMADNVIGEPGMYFPYNEIDTLGKYPVHEIVDALMEARWVLKGFTYQNGVYHGCMELTPKMITFQVGGEGVVLGEERKSTVSSNVIRCPQCNRQLDVENVLVDEVGVICLHCDPCDAVYDITIKSKR